MLNSVNPGSFSPALARPLATGPKCCSRRSDVTPILISLLRRPFKFRNQLQIIVIAFRALLAPSYITSPGAIRAPLIRVCWWFLTPGSTKTKGAKFLRFWLLTALPLDFRCVDTVDRPVCLVLLLFSFSFILNLIL